MYFHPRISPAPIPAPTRMLDVLIPVDGSASSDRAVRFVIRMHRIPVPLHIRLLNVQLPQVLKAGRMADIVDSGNDAATEGDPAMLSARRLLEAAGIPFVAETRQGYVAQAISHYAKESGCSLVVMGTRGMGTTDELLGSIARQVINLVDIPVTLVK
jgi:nucleotide-binding universal stress UspA family protein